MANERSRKMTRDEIVESIAKVERFILDAPDGLEGISVMRSLRAHAIQAIALARAGVDLSGPPVADVHALAGPMATVSSVRVVSYGAHEHVEVWNRGGLSGTLTVCRGDGEKIRALLLAARVEAP